MVARAERVVLVRLVLTFPHVSTMSRIYEQLLPSCPMLVHALLIDRIPCSQYCLFSTDLCRALQTNIKFLPVSNMTRIHGAIKRWAVSAAVFVAGLDGVRAYSNGAGGDCPSGQAAVGDVHTMSDAWGTSRPVVQTSLIDAGIRFTINNVTINDNVDLTVSDDEEYQVRYQGDYEFAVETDTDKPFKGALIRVSQASNSGNGETSFIAGTNSHTALSCTAAGASGVTHLDSEAKTYLSGYFHSSATEPVQIDVTVVLYNNSTGSVYAYQSFNVGVFVAQSTPAPTSAPFAAIEPPPVPGDNASVPDAEVSATTNPPQAPTDGFDVSDAALFGSIILSTGYWLLAVILAA